MRAGKHRAAGSNIQKPKPESAASRHSSLKDTPRQNFSEVKPEPYDATVASMIEQMPANGDWSSILADDCNPYLMPTGMDLETDKFKHQQFSAHYSDDFAVRSPSDLSLDPSHLMNQSFFRGSPQTFPDYFENRTLTNSTLTSTNQSQPTSRRGSPVASCSCNQKILQHLLKLSSIPEISSAYDEALNQNKQIINLCHNILEDQTHHHHDISFVLTLTALIAKVISVYDAIYNPFNQPNPSPNPNDLAALTTDHLTTFHNLDMASEQIDPISMSAPSSTFPTRPNTPPFSSSLNSPHTHAFPMRLTLGTYRLDQKDEEKLKWDIFKIELSKVGQLLRAFEQKYCDGGVMAVREPQKMFEAKAYDDMVFYLQKRLRVSMEMPRGAMSAFV
ncbi:uncharacterized protein KY384_007375 [Bacidia gigantensis]|uniref:uncharacterized protein n=1 Tax=Bacidia gigantensis TaxID=2732470 RepID=UPI001D036C22|nr:uncharacterized protein KY384_007375 [Bacidia gigantensis]KAG8528457.1 hypothetical protein KY384_007375 [Bacidia gigantensis]